MLRAGGPLGSGALLGYPGLQNAVPAPPSLLQSWTLRAWPRGHLGKMPVQGTNRQAHCQLQEAVSCSQSGLQSSRASLPLPRRVEMRTGSREHPFPRAQQLWARPTGFLWQGRPRLSFLCLALARLPAQLSAAECTLGNGIHLTCFPESRMAGQANTATVGNGPQLRLLLPVFLGELGWEIVLNCLGLPRLE